MLSLISEGALSKNVTHEGALSKNVTANRWGRRQKVDEIVVRAPHFRANPAATERQDVWPGSGF